MENIKLTIKVFSLAFCATLYVAIWIWFIITGCDNSDNWDSLGHVIFLFWIMLHIVCLIGVILWAWN